MAIITCPQCNNKISDKAKACPHCEVDMDMDEEKRLLLAGRQRSAKIKSLTTQSMLAVLLALAGFYIMYFQTPEKDSVQMLLAQVAFGAGFLWYLVNRIRTYMLKNMGK